MQAADRNVKYSHAKRYELVDIPETTPTAWTRLRDLWTGTPWHFKVSALFALAIYGAPVLVNLF